MSIDQGSYGAMKKFMRLSKKIGNQTPSVATDDVGEGHHTQAYKGPARGRQFESRVSTKPMAIRKKVSGNGKSPSAPKKKLPPRNKGIVKRYK